MDNFTYVNILIISRGAKLIKIDNIKDYVYKQAPDWISMRVGGESDLKEEICHKYL